MSNVRGEHIPPAIARSIIASVIDAGIARRVVAESYQTDADRAEAEAIRDYLNKIDNKPKPPKGR